MPSKKTLGIKKERPSQKHQSRPAEVVGLLGLWPYHILGSVHHVANIE